MRRPLGWLPWAALVLITLGAATLRLIHLGEVRPDPFYDAAVRSMTLSWHNFFFGAFEPGASVSIDKPPVDLWLQVASVKLFGFSATPLKLPEALGGTAAVPLLFLAVRRMWSTPAALAAALAQAVLPIEVITSRSDTMDGVMMALIVLALLLIVRASETGSSAWLLAGAAALGVAFDVKLLESLVALPGLAVLAYLGLPGTRRTRMLKLLGAGAVYVVVALAWLGATLLAPAHDRPYAIGSTNGSAWNAAFVFNGTDRLSGKSIEAQTLYHSGANYPQATQIEREAIPIVPPSPTRLLARIGPLSGERLGLELLLALLLGIPALIGGALLGAEPIKPASLQPARDEHSANGGGASADPLDAREPVQAQPGGVGATIERRDRIRRAAAAGLLVWLITGVALFSEMARLHPRYVEAFVPAVTATLGIGAAWAVSGCGRARLITLSLSMALLVLYGERLLYGAPLSWWLALAGALGALAIVALKQIGVGSARRPPALLGAGALGMTMLAVLAIPVAADLSAVEHRISDAGNIGALASGEQRILSTYLIAHQGSARYELASGSATAIGSLIVQDARPVVVLTSYEGRVFTSVAKLKRLIADGAVRYAFLNTYCSRHTAATSAGCSAPAKWVRAHGKDVSRRAGLSQAKVLYLLPGAQS